MRLIRITAAFGLLLMAAFVAACSKDSAVPEPSGQPIAFRLGVSTRVGQDASTLADGGGSVIVNGSYTQGTTTTTLQYGSSSDLSLQKVGDYWYPGGNSSWDSWKAGCSYSFMAYAFSPTSAKSAGLLSVTSPGVITINQPQEYSYGSEDETMVDYLLSHRFSVTDGSYRPIVRLQFEHAVSLVEIYVIRDASITEATVGSLTLSNFFTSASMTCASPLQYGDNGYNSWSVSVNGSQNGNYSMNGTFSTATTVDAMSSLSSPALMQVLAVPQNLSGNAQVPSVSVTYSVNENGNMMPHGPESFPLVASGLPTQWQPGYKYTYVITIDTGIHLSAHVAAWKDGGTIEATVLPGNSNNTGSSNAE